MQQAYGWTIGEIDGMDALLLIDQLAARAKAESGGKCRTVSIEDVI